MTKKRVVITGMGALTPIGNNVDEYWQGLLEGRSGAETITQFDVENISTKFAASVKNFDPKDHFPPKEVKRMDRFVQFALYCTDQAMKDAKLDMDAEDPNRVAVIIGSGIGGIETFEKQARTIVERGPQRISPFFIPMMIADLAAGEVSIRTGAKGPNYCTVSACASGAHAIGEAFRTIQHGSADVVITGGTEASITPLAMAGFANMRALSQRNDSPATASRPFDVDRDGFVMGEGSGILILESLEHATKRGANIWGEIAGYGATGDAYHITAPPPGGEGAVRSIRLALADGGVDPGDVDYINAHGTSTPPNDKNETAAIKTVFEEHAYKLAVSSTKSMTGHLLGASGAIEFLALLLTIKNGMIPPTINYETPDPDCDLDYVPNKARQRDVNIGISNSFGFGGHNVTLLARKYNGK